MENKEQTETFETQYLLLTAILDLSEHKQEFEKLKQLHKQEIQKLVKENDDLIDGCNNWIEIIKEKDKDLISLKFQKCELHNKLEPILQIKGEYEKEIEKLKKKLKGGKR